MKDNLTSKERVNYALNHKEADRVPIDFGGINNTTMHYKTQNALLKYLGYEELDEPNIRSFSQKVVIPDERILDYIGSDTRCIYVDESKEWIKNTEGNWVDHWGIEYIDDPEMNFRNLYKSPLDNISTIDELDEYKFPNPREPKIIEGIKEKAMKLSKDYYLVLEGVRGSVFELVSWIRGIQNFYIDLLINPELAGALLDKIVDYQIELISFVLEEVGEYIDAIKVADDFGTQTSLLISEEVYCDIIKPRQARIYKAIKEKSNCKILLHCCGSIKPLIPHFIEIGVDAINPVQISAENMNPIDLKEEFGDKITFWGGGIDTQVVLPTGSKEEIREEVRKNIDIFKKNGGYIFAPVHNITPGVPVESIIALFDAYKEFCNY